MKKGDKIRIHLYGHGDGCADDCGCAGSHLVEGTVVEVLKEGFVKATMDDEAHPLCNVDDKPRVLTVAPEMYEAL